ncbi:MAG: 50S ribosomal protein L25 [Deltaproteobacteria bacterium]|nr:50S ribosomal protein L25 [Deltaproteobacteria bacterium]
MEQINISAVQRTEKGKCSAGRLRRAGKIPAVLYGPSIIEKGKGAITLTFNCKEVEKALHGAAGGNVLVNLSVAGEAKPRMCMFKAVTRHPLKATIEHIDLLEILMTHTIAVDVPVHIVGKAAGVALGGIMQLESRKVKIECLPTQIPSSLDVDVTALNIGQSLHVRDITLAPGLKVVGDTAATIVSIVAPAAEEAPKTAEEAQAELAKSFEETEKEGKEGEAKEGKEAKAAGKEAKAGKEEKPVKAEKTEKSKK